MKILLSSLILFIIYFSPLIAEEKRSDQSTLDDVTNKLADQEDLLKMYGYITAYMSGMKDLGFGADEADAISSGVRKALIDEVRDPYYEDQDRMAQLQAFINDKIKSTQSIREERQIAQLEENLTKGKEFINDLAFDKSVKSTASGLHYKVLKQGKSKRAESSDTVRVHYKGTRIDGTVFDSSYKRGEPADFSLQGVVPGFAEGLTKIGEGGKIILYIPSDLAYGDNIRGKIQPGDTLIFECELIKINP